MIKTDKNQSNCHKILILKAFRELPSFYEDITENSGDTVIIEEYINAKAYFEITLFNSQIKLISQTGFDKSMHMRHSWRVFPIKLPEKINNQVISMIECFPEIVQIQNIPIRFSFAMTRPDITLLSVNAGLNRHEYHPDWSAACGLNNLLTETIRTPETDCINKIMHFYDLSRDCSQQNELKALCPLTLKKTWQFEDNLTVLLSSDRSEIVLEEGKRIKAHMNQYRQIQICENESEPDKD